MPGEKCEIEPEEEYRKDSGCCMGGCLKGCFLLLLVMVLVIGGCTYIVSKNWRGWAASFGGLMIDEALEESNLPDQEKDEIQQELERPLNALRDGRLSIGQMEELGNVLLESPLMPSLAVTVVEAQYFARSGLTDAEKLSGGIALHRFARGVIDNRIGDPAVEAVMSHIATKEDDGEWQFKKTATDEELRRMIATAAQEADRAGIPPQVPEIDPSDEIRCVIDEVMGPAGVEQGPVPR